MNTAHFSLRRLLCATTTGIALLLNSGWGLANVDPHAGRFFDNNGTSTLEQGKLPNQRYTNAGEQDALGATGTDVPFTTFRSEHNDARANREWEPSLWRGLVFLPESAT